MIFDTDPTGESAQLSKLDIEMRDEIEARVGLITLRVFKSEIVNFFQALNIVELLHRRSFRTLRHECRRDRSVKAYICLVNVHIGDL